MAVTTADINSLTSSIDNLVRSISSQSRFSTKPQGAGGDNASRLLARREKHNVRIYENIVKNTKNSSQVLKQIEKISKEENKLSLRIIHANSQLEKVMEKAYEDGKSGQRVLENLPTHFRDALEKLSENKEDKISGIDFKSITATIEDTFDIQDSMDTLKSVIDEMKLKGEDDSYKKNFELFGEGIIDTSATIHQAVQENASKFGESIIDTSATIHQAVKENAQAVQENQKVIKSDFDAYVKRFKKLGINFDELMKTSKDYNEVVKKLEKASIKMTEAANKAAKSSEGGSIGGIGKIFGGAKNLFGKIKGGIVGFLAGELFGTLKQFAKDFGDEVGTQMKFGYAIPMADFPDIALKFGMNIKEAAEFLGKQRDVMNARNLGEEEYRKILEDGSKILMNYIGDQAEATKAFANTIRDTRRFGDATIDSAAAARRQTDLFKDSFAPLGVLHEGFENLRESVLSNEGNMVTLGALQRDQREEFILGIQQQHKYYLALGFNIEQTKRATEVLSALAKESPLERMKKGASLGAMMGMAGMGAEGTRMQDYMKRFHTLTPEERKDLQEMKTEVSNRFTQMYGDQQGGILFEQMAHQQGWASTFADLESITKEGMTADEKRATEEVARHKLRTEKFEESLTYLKAIEAASNSSVGLLGMLAIKAGTGLLGGKNAEWIKTVEGFTGKILKGEFDQILPKSKTSTEAGRLDMRQTGEQNKLSFLSQSLADLNKEREKKINEAGEIAVGKGTIRLSNEDTLKRTKDIEEKYQKEKEELLENMNKTLKNLEYYNKQSTELQKKGNQAADKTKDNTDKTAKELEAQNEKAKDLNKIYQMKISRVSSSPTN